MTTSPTPDVPAHGPLPPCPDLSGTAPEPPPELPQAARGAFSPQAPYSGEPVSLPDAPLQTPPLPVLVERWRLHADHAAAHTLVEALYPQVLRIVHNHRPRGVPVEDLAQDVFVQFFKTLDRYDPQRPLENWMSRLAVNVCLKSLRKHRLNHESNWSDLSEAEQAVLDSLAQECDPKPFLPPAEARGLLNRLLDSLSPEDRLILTLLHLEEKSVAQVAEMTGWSRVVIKVRAFRARNKLRKALEKLHPKTGGPL
jgi:RNA polymerase sigma-70 factor (ECF subfamily)